MADCALMQNILSQYYPKGILKALIFQYILQNNMEMIQTRLYLINLWYVTYLSQVQFYFKHTVHLLNGLTEHYLAFMNWYKPAATANIRFLFSSKNSDDFTNDPELWKKEFFNSSVDSIILIHHILGTVDLFQQNLNTNELNIWPFYR